MAQKYTGQPLVADDPRAHGNPPLLRLAILQPTLAPHGSNHQWEFYFPVMPQVVQFQYNALSTIYDTQGPPETHGVSRVADQYGFSPPTWAIQGTPGWQPHPRVIGGHLYAWNGLDAISTLKGLIEEFHDQNQRQRQNQRPMYLLECDDYFNDEYWYVVPSGPQRFNWSAQQPLWGQYALTLQGVRAVGHGKKATTSTDSIANSFSVSTDAWSRRANAGASALQ